jgi:hypothetical protein
MEFKIDFGNVAAAVPVDAPLFAATPGIALSLGGDEVLYRLRADASHHVMTRQVFEALQRCGGFASLDQHAADIARHLPGLDGRTDVVRRVLDSLLARGLLQDADHWLATLARGSATAPAPLRAVFVHVDGTPLAPLLEDLRAAGSGAHPLVAIDDSTDAAALRANAEAVAHHAQAGGARGVHLDPARRRALVDELLGAVPQAAAAAGLLLGPGAGAARNLAVLLSAGARAVLLDAAARLPLRRAPDAREGLDLAGDPAIPVRFHPRMDDALADGEPLAGDPITALLAACGQPLGALLSGPAGAAVTRAGLAGLAPAALPHLAADTRVLGVVAGRRGVARAAGREWLFLLEPGSRERFWADRDAYLRTLDSASLCAAPARARVLARGLEAHTAIDASRMLAPTLAAGEGVDALAGLMAQALWPQSAVLHPALTIARMPAAGARRAAPDWDAETPDLASLLTDLLAPRTAELSADAPAPRLHALAAIVADLAAAAPSRQVDLVSEYLAFCRADSIARLQATFAAAPAAPVYWQADVRALIEANARALTAGAPPRLADWPAQLDAAGCAARFANELSAYAAALDAWPALWAHALAQGARLLER